MASTERNRDYMRKSGLCDTLKTLNWTVKSCFGPGSRLKLLQNDSGGQTTMTSSSGRILARIKSDEPIVKVLVNAVKKHVELNIDGGLFCFALALSLVRDSISLNENRILVAKIYQDLHTIIDDYFQNEEIEGVRRFDFSSLSDLMTLCESVLRPKSGCVLDETENRHVCKVLVEAFIKSFSPEASNSISDIQFIKLQGASPLDMTYLEGILIERDPDSPCAPLNLTNGVKSVLVTTSLAGDHGTDDDVAYVGKTDNVMDDVIDVAVYERMTRLCDRWIGDDVKLVLCQKVVHWSVRDYLRKAGIEVIHRLGLSTVQYLQRITGGGHVASILEPASVDAYAFLKSVHMVEFCDRSYYQLSTRDSTLASSLVVINRNEESLAELEYVSRVALDSMRIAARHPRLIRGRGYFEAHAAQYLRGQVSLRHLRLMQTHRCSRFQLYAITEQFCRSLQSTVSHFTLNEDDFNANLLEDFIRLSLGSKEKDNDLGQFSNDDGVDLLCVKMAALHTAVFTACALIQVDDLFETQTS